MDVAGDALLGLHHRQAPLGGLLRLQDRSPLEGLVVTVAAAAPGGADESGHRHQQPGVGDDHQPSHTPMSVVADEPVQPHRRHGRPRQLEGESHPPPRRLQAGLRRLHRHEGDHGEEQGGLREQHQVSAQADTSHQDEDHRGVAPHRHGQGAGPRHQEEERRRRSLDGLAPRLRPSEQG